MQSSQPNTISSSSYGLPLTCVCPPKPMMTGLNVYGSGVSTIPTIGHTYGQSTVYTVPGKIIPREKNNSFYLSCWKKIWQTRMMCKQDNRNIVSINVSFRKYACRSGSSTVRYWTSYTTQFIRYSSIINTDCHLLSNNSMKSINWCSHAYSCSLLNTLTTNRQSNYCAGLEINFSSITLDIVEVILTCRVWTYLILLCILGSIQIRIAVSRNHGMHLFIQIYRIH
jgi:hypothetical protein